MLKYFNLREEIMKNFIDFIVDVAKDNGIAKEFEKHVEGSDHKGMSAWLKDKGYDVHEDECKKMVDNKENLKSSKVGWTY